MNQAQNKVKSVVKTCLISLTVFGVLFMLFCFFNLLTSSALAETGTTAKNVDPSVIKWAFLSAAIAVGMGSIGAGIAVSYVGSAAVGAVGEKPEIAGRVLIFVGLAEGVAIYGLLIAMFILFKV